MCPAFDVMIPERGEKLDACAQESVVRLLEGIWKIVRITIVGNIVSEQDDPIEGAFPHRHDKARNRVGPGQCRRSACLPSQRAGQPSLQWVRVDTLRSGYQTAPAVPEKKNPFPLMSFTAVSYSLSLTRKM